MGLFAFSSIVTALGMGWVGDRWNKSLVCSVAMVPTVLALVGLLFSQAPPVIYFFPLGLSLTQGIAPLNWAVIGDFFGRRSYATLRGIMAVGHGITTFLSPIYAGWIFDKTESYNLVLVSFAVILLVSSFLFALLGRPFPSKRTAFTANNRNPRW